MTVNPGWWCLDHNEFFSNAQGIQTHCNTTQGQLFPHRIVHVNQIPQGGLPTMQGFTIW